MKIKPFLLLLPQVLVLGCVEGHEPITAQQRLDMFYEQSMPESNLIPFLVEGGEELVPLLIVDIRKKDTPKRRYIIGAVGQLKDERALSPLTSVVLDSTEEDYFRCDALKSLSQINPKYLESIPSDAKEVIQTNISRR